MYFFTNIQREKCLNALSLFTSMLSGYLQSNVRNSTVILFLFFKDHNAMFSLNHLVPISKVMKLATTGNL